MGGERAADKRRGKNIVRSVRLGQTGIWRQRKAAGSRKGRLEVESSFWLWDCGSSGRGRGGGFGGAWQRWVVVLLGAVR